jgi:predicted nuclease of predicted toxin-antitoxin system
MLKVLLDACVPRRLIRGLAEFDVETAQHAGLDQLPDSALLAAIDGHYDVLVTRDRNLIFQHKIAGRSVAVVVLRSLDQSPAAFDALLPELKIAIGAATPGTVTLVGEASS